MTNSPVNHVGMVVALDDLPPLLWHAELGRSLPDVWTGERQRGVQLHRLDDAVTTWSREVRPARLGAPARPAARSSATTRTASWRSSSASTARRFRRCSSLAGRWVTGRVRRRPTAPLETIYCAELVATTYQHMGLLPDKRPASFYDPGAFWSGDRIELVAPFRLAEEIAVKG